MSKSTNSNELIDGLASVAYGLDALQTMRAYGKSLFDAYINRLTHATGRTATPPGLLDKADGAQAAEAKAGSTEISSLMRRWRDYALQAKTLRQRDLSKGLLAIAIASSRLHNPTVPSPREQLKALSKSLVGPGIEDQIDSSKTILLFEPAFESASWNEFAICEAEGVFVIDTGFLLYLLMHSPVSCVTTIAGVLFQMPAVRKRWPGADRRSLLVAALIRRAYELLFRGTTDVQALFLTSNSHATEVLRIHLIKSRHCSRITEILHGVPTVEVEQYFEQVLRLDHAKKHFFIEQIPNLLTSGIISERKQAGIAINPYLNRFLAGNVATGEAQRASIQAQLDDLQLREGHVIVTFGGGMAVHRRSYFGSEAFKIECQLMTQIADHFRSNQIPFQLLYAVHPLFLQSELDRCQFFRNHDVQVCRSTVFTWLVSDYFVSLLSSSMFEAAYFGAKAFAPITIADGYYSPTLLQLLSHPKAGDEHSLAIALRELLDSGRTGKADEDLLRRAERRLSRMRPEPVPQNDTNSYR